VYDSLVVLHLLVSGVYIEQFGITKVVIHLLLSEFYIEQLGIANVVMHLLVPEVYREQFGIGTPDTRRCMKTLDIQNCSI
jgi:hypothetical protein